MPKNIWSAGEIADELGVQTHRVRFILIQYPEITPIGRVAGWRVFDKAGLEAVREQLARQDERRELRRAKTQPA